MPEKIISSLIRALAIGLAICALLLVILSAILSAQLDPAPLIPIASYAVIAIGAAICGYLAVTFTRAKGLLCGSLAGALYSAVILTVGTFLGNQNGAFCFLISLGCILLSALFGYLALPKAPNAASARKKALLHAGKKKHLLGK